MATLELTLHHPLRWRRLIHVSNQRKGVRPPLQRPGVLAIVTFMSKGRVPMRSTGSVAQPIELLSGLTNLSKYPINFSLVATLELTLHHLLPLRWRRHSIVSNQRKGVRPPLQRPGVLAIVTFVSKGRVPMWSTGSVEQPIKLLSKLTY